MSCLFRRHESFYVFRGPVSYSKSAIPSLLHSIAPFNNLCHKNNDYNEIEQNKGELSILSLRGVLSEMRHLVFKDLSPCIIIIVKCFS